MSKSIKKFERFPPELIKMQEDANTPFVVGDMFFTSRGDDVIRVRELWQDERWADDKGKKKEKYWKVSYDHATNWEATKWSSCGSDEFEDFIKKIKNGQYTKLDRPLSEVMSEANKVISGEISMDVYKHSELTNSLNNESALISRGSKDGLLAIQKGLEEKKNVASLIHKAVAYEMEKRKAELEKIKDNLYGIVAVFEKQVKKIMRVITTIELYLGIEEELHQIQEGEKAPADTTLCFRQMVLYIDEEVGAWEDGGLDFRNISEFDTWLTTDNNIDIVLPEKKGMVVFNPRRNKKEYHNDFKNSFWNVENLYRTYILIRNGDCLYRIFTEKLVIEDRLFPKKKELNELYEKLQKETWDTNKEKIEDSMYQYKKQAMLLQGLVDRTEVFHPLPVEKLNIFKLNEAGEKVKFIYDAEASLPTGKLPFNDWWEIINEKIQHGSRILITGVYPWQERYSKWDVPWSERFYLAKGKSDGLKNVPDKPKEGVYEVEEFYGSSSNDYRETEFNKMIKKLEEAGTSYKVEDVKGKHWTHGDDKTGNRKIFRIRTYDDEADLTIMYMPDEPASDGWNRWDTHDRKVRTRFKIEKDDSFVINYDQIELSDVDFYIKSRVDRPNYLSMMPVLKKLRKHLIEEIKKEEFFIQFLIGRNKDIANIESKVRESISWWKFKNKIKRAITKDDTLALRMIEKRITSKTYKS